MTNGEGHGTQFARVAHATLELLSSTTGLPAWAVVRHDIAGDHALVAVDPTGQVQAGTALPTEETPTSRIAVDVHLSDGTFFGTVVGWGTRQTPAVIDEITKLAAVLADALGALASSELELTLQRRMAEIREGQTDPLTGLGTRQAWDRRMRADERWCAEFGASAAVIVIELDDLRRSNELHGHSAGDEQIRLAGEVMRNTIGGRHYAARVTGDRLAVLMIDVITHEVGELERALRQALSGMQISAVVGVSRREPTTGLAVAWSTAEAMLEDARSMQGVEMPDADLASELLAAIERGHVMAYVQPIVDLRSGAVVAVEALARWSAPDGMREPSRFLRSMQDAGLLGALFDRILDDGLSHLVRFRNVVPNLRLAVNVEFDTTTETTLLTSVTDRLTAHGLPPDALSLELSERQTFDLPEPVRRELNAVADLGVQLMLDDFGTGFASLETLTSLPISGVKLDRKFTGQVIDGDREPVVVKAMIALAAEAGLTVIAEGIETQVQCDRLVRLGCRLGQGYLFALPQPPDAVAEVLSAPLVTTF